MYYGNSDKVTRSWSFRTGLFPTQDLVDCYLQKDEADGKWKHWWETKQARDLNIAVTTDKDGNKEYSGSGDDYRKMFENRDKRFYATVTYDGAYMGPKAILFMRYRHGLTRQQWTTRRLCNTAPFILATVIWRILSRLQLAVLHNRPLVATIFTSTLTSTSLTMTEH